MLGTMLAPVVIWMAVGAVGGHLISRWRREVDGLAVPLGLLLGPLAWPVLMRCRAAPAIDSPPRDAHVLVGVAEPAGMGRHGPSERPDRVHPDVVAALQSPHWTLDDGHLRCRPHDLRYCERCAASLG